MGYCEEDLDQLGRAQHRCHAKEAHGMNSQMGDLNAMLHKLTRAANRPYKGGDVG